MPDTSFIQSYLVLLYYIIPGVFIIAAILSSIVIVGGTQIAILERRWLGKSIPEGRVVALRNEVGIQARTLGPGLHMVVPFLYRVTKSELTVIGENEVGLVDSIDGKPVPDGHIFAKAFKEHNLFQDGESFLIHDGEKGPQIQILPPGSYRINPYLFRVTKTAVVSIDNNEIGVAVATDGAPISQGRLLGNHIEGHNSFQSGAQFLANGGQKGPQIDILLPGTYRINTKLFEITVMQATTIPVKEIGLVTARDGEPLPPTEYIAKQVTGHQDFQSGAGFLANGGERGPQLDFLKPGTYYINPLLFDVTRDSVLVVERGEVAVIVSTIGKDPSLEPNAVINRDKGEDDGVERYVVNAGYRGIQREVLGPGTYYLNKLAFTPHIIPTTNITIDWAQDRWAPKTPVKKGPADTNYVADKLSENTDVAKLRTFNPLNIVSKDGFEMSVEVKVILRVLPEQAPHMVARIGTIENLVEDVIHPLIDSSFRNQASSSEAMQFMQDRYAEQSKAEMHSSEELEKYHVQCVSVLICQIKLPDRLMQTLTDKVVASQQKAMYDSQQEAEGRRAEMEKTKAQADLQPSLVKAEIDVKIATQQKQQNIILAEGQSQSTRLQQEGIAAGIASVGRAEAEKISAIGQSTAQAYQLQADALGQQPMSVIEIMKQVAQGNVKITPDILVNSSDGKDGGNANNVLAAFIASLMGNNAKIVAEPKSRSKPASEE